MFQALLNTGDVGPGLIVPGLGPVEVLGPFMVVFPERFQGSFQVHPFGQKLFKFQLGIADFTAPGLKIVIQGFPAQHRQLGFLFALFLFVGFVFFRSCRLSFQVLQLTAKLFAKVCQPLQVLLGATNAVLGFPPPFFVLGNARRFLDVHPQFLGFRLNQPGNHALLDDGITARPETGAEEQIGDVAASAFGTVQEIFRLPFTGYPAFH